jgi:hypothetical protein
MQPCALPAQNPVPARDLDCVVAAPLRPRDSVVRPSPLWESAPFGGDDRIELGAQPFLVRAHEGEKFVVDRGPDQLVGERVAGCRVHGHHLPFERALLVRR